MKVSVRTPHLELTRAQLDLVRQRLYLAFARIAPWVREVEVTLTDVNGPRGGLDKRCRLVLRTRTTGPVVVEQVGFDVLISLGEAAVRAEQALVRKIGRRRALDLNAP